MKSTYPKRLINFLSISLMIIGFMAIAREIGQLRNNLANLTEIDKQSSFLAIGLVSIVLVCCIGSMKRKYWGWIGITSYLIYSIGGYILDSYRYGNGDRLIVIIIPVMLILIVVLIFLFLNDVTKYFEVSFQHKILAMILSIGAYLSIARNPNPNPEIINFYYVDIVEEQYYLNEELYTGKVFSNHTNGNIEFEGHIKKGKEEGVWVYFHDNGQLQNTVTYLGGKPNGKDLTYFSNGTLREEKYYRDGKLDGEYKLWYDEDELDITGNFKNNKRHGEWKQYESQIIKIDRYIMDTLIETEYLEIENPADNK